MSFGIVPFCRTMNRLSDELLGKEIFSWLSDADWARCDRVCKRWHGLTLQEPSREDRLYGWKRDPSYPDLWERMLRDGRLEIAGRRKMSKSSEVAIVLRDLFGCDDNDVPFQVLFS